MQSLSGTGHCYDNARMESFFATLKKEKLYRIPTYHMTREEIKTIIFRYIFIYYNRKRLYTGNPGSLPPAEFYVRQEQAFVNLVKGEACKFHTARCGREEAISKEILTKQGLISISDYYQKVAHI